MKYEKIEDVRIYHQGVDTLRTSHVIMMDFCYDNYMTVLNLLSQAKSKAIDANANYEFGNGITFEFLNFGNFKISPKGQGRFKYVISNQDMTFYFSAVKFGANEFNTPQITIDFRSRYLTLLGHEKAYALALATLREMLGAPVDYTSENPFIKTFCQRIDLCTDVGGMQYTPSDKYRFQANFKRNNYIEFFEHLQFNRLTGFSFGKGDFMLRIYDKRLELNRNASKLWLTQKWVDNGYDEYKRPSVWRHEVQLRRPHLKYFITENCKDEVRFLFDMLPELWTYSINKITWVDLNKEEVSKIMEVEYSPDALRQMFYRAKKDDERLSFWNMLNIWDNKISAPAEKLERFKITDYSVPKRFLKAFLTTAYKVSDGNPLEVIELLNNVNIDCLEYEGHTLHAYAQNRLLSSYIDNAYFVSNHGLVVDKDYTDISTKLYEEIKEVFEHLDDPVFKSNKRRLEELNSFSKCTIENDLIVSEDCINE